MCWFALPNKSMICFPIHCVASQHNFFDKDITFFCWPSLILPQSTCRVNLFIPNAVLCLAFLSQIARHIVKLSFIYLYLFFGKISSPITLPHESQKTRSELKYTNSIMNWKKHITVWPKTIMMQFDVDNKFFIFPNKIYFTSDILPWI